MATVKVDIGGTNITASQLSEFFRLAAIPGSHINRASLQVLLEDRAKPFDEAAYYQTRPGLYVNPDLKRYVGLQVRATRGAKALKPPRLLLNNESEATMFGELGSPKHAQTLANAVDLGQIAGKIEAQKNGEDGELLTEGEANIFPVCGLDGALRVVDVGRDDGKWLVVCRPFRADFVWLAGFQVFSN